MPAPYEPLAPWSHRPVVFPSVDNETFRGRLRRRVRDLMIMGIVGPAAGVLAIAAIHFAAALHPAADARTARLDRPVAPAAVAVLPPYSTQVAPRIPVLPPEPPPATAAEFGNVEPTDDVRRMADWVVGRHDNGKMPFIVLDKRAARLYVFEPGGVLLEDTPVLLGSAHGDDTFPGIGNVPIAQVKPYQRTTAAGRFVTQPGLDADHTDVVWLDYDAALAMHRVINKVKAEHRLQRLASPDPAQRRVSWGCINIPIDFFDRRISPVFGHQHGVTYVIPEKKTFAEVFERGARPAAPVVASLAPTSSAAPAPHDIGDR